MSYSSIMASRLTAVSASSLKMLFVSIFSANALLTQQGRANDELGDRGILGRRTVQRKADVRDAVDCRHGRCATRMVLAYSMHSNSDLRCHATKGGVQ